MTNVLSIPSVFTQNDKPYAGFSLPYIASRVLNTPLAITADKAEEVLSFLMPRIEGHTPIEKSLLELNNSGDASSIVSSDLSFAEIAQRNGIAVINAQTTQGTRARNDQNRDLGFDLIPTQSGNIAVIPINGVLVQRGAFLRESSGMTSYQGIRTTINNALTDARVSSILMYINSPGGEAYGLFDLASALRLLAQGETQPKPIFAFTDGTMASAAYALGSATSRVYSEAVAVVGSIGVLLVHRDKSAANAASGLTVTYIASGTQKADGNEDTALSQEVRARFQARVDKIAGMFFENVAVARQGADAKVNMSVESIAALQAGVFLGDEAAEKGLTDGVRTLRQVVDEMSLEMQKRKRGERTTGGVSQTQAQAQAQAHFQTQPQTQSQSQSPAQGGRIMPNPIIPSTQDQAPAPLVYDAQGNPVQMDALLSAIPQFAQMSQQLTQLNTKLQDREERLEVQTSRVETLLTTQEQKDMMQLVTTQLRGLPIQPNHLASMFLRLKPLDATLYGEFLTTFTVLARVFNKSNAITQQQGRASAVDAERGILTQVGEGTRGGTHIVDTATQAERFMSEDGTTMLEVTPQIKAFDTAVKKYVVDHGCTELTAIEMVMKNNPEILESAKDSMGAGAASGQMQTRVIDDPDAGSGVEDAGGVTAGDILNPEADGAMIGALSGPDVAMLTASESLEE